MSQGSPAVDEVSEVFTPLYPVRSKFVFFLPFQHGVVGGGLLIHICDCETHNLTYLLAHVPKPLSLRCAVLLL